MKTVTSATVFLDTVGTRISITYSEIDETTGKIVSDNKRIDRVVTDQSAKGTITELLGYAQDFVDNLEE